MPCGEKPPTFNWFFKPYLMTLIAMRSPVLLAFFALLAFSGQLGSSIAFTACISLLGAIGVLHYAYLCWLHYAHTTPGSHKSKLMRPLMRRWEDEYKKLVLRLKHGSDRRDPFNTLYDFAGSRGISYQRQIQLELSLGIDRYQWFIYDGGKE